MHLDSHLSRIVQGLSCKVHITNWSRNSPPLEPILSHFSVVATLTLSFYKYQFNNIHLCLGQPSCLFLQVFRHRNFAFLTPRILFDLITLIMFGEGCR